MTIDVRELSTRTLHPDVAYELDRYESTVAEFLRGEIDEDTFRVFRLNNGVYGQRQGGHNQMIRIKIPYGAITPEQFEVLAYISENYSRGWGHLTTRQNVQFHFVQLETSVEALRLLASVGLTSREACGDTVRNVTGCHLAGACPYEVLDISAWAEATTQYFLRSPYAQRLPRKFKINFSGCATDCGQAMFNDVGVVAVNRPLPDGSTEAGFRVYVAGGLGATPHPAQALEDFTSRADLMPTIEACLRTFDHYGNRDNKLRARMKWLVDTMEGGIDELRERVIKERKFLRAAWGWPGGVPTEVLTTGDAPAGVGEGPISGAPGGTPVTFLPARITERAPDASAVTVSDDPYERWAAVNVVRGVANNTVSAYAWCRLGDITTEQFRALAEIQRDFHADVRITNRQNLVFRNLGEADLHGLWERLTDIDMAMPGAELSRDVVACPGADTCNLAVTQSRGLADAIGSELEAAGLAEVGGIRVNISGCTNSCGQHHVADIGFMGMERRAHGRAAPGYQMLLGGGLGQMEVDFGDKALKLPARNAPKAVVAIVERFTGERTAGESFGEWLERSGGAGAVGKTLAHFDEFASPEDDPELYVDFGETGPYVKEVGDSECAT